MKQIIIFLFVACVTLVACHDVKVGYLRVDSAEFFPDTILIRSKLVTAEENPYKNDQNRIDNNAPWVTTNISGVLGTEPLTYEFVSVKASEGGDGDLFAKEIVVRGCGKMQIPLKPMAPKGRYLVTLKVSNEGYSALLPDVFTFVIE